MEIYSSGFSHVHSLERRPAGISTTLGDLHTVTRNLGTFQTTAGGTTLGALGTAAGSTTLGTLGADFLKVYHGTLNRITEHVRVDGVSECNLASLIASITGVNDVCCEINNVSRICGVDLETTPPSIGVFHCKH